MKRALTVFLVLVLSVGTISLGSIPATASQITPLPSTLQNGSFETNPVSSQTTPTSYQVPVAQFSGWETSDSLSMIEIWRSGMKPAGNAYTFNALNDGTTNNGNWFAEINANNGPETYAATGPSFIWQDLTTTPGALYQWSFYHRGRNGTDTAKMLLGPLAPINATYALANAQPEFLSTSSDPTLLLAGQASWAQHLGYWSAGATTTEVRYSLYSFNSVPGPTGTSADNRAAEGNLVDAANWIMVAAPNITTWLSGTVAPSPRA